MSLECQGSSDWRIEIDVVDVYGQRYRSVYHHSGGRDDAALIAEYHLSQTMSSAHVEQATIGAIREEASDRGA